MTLSTRNIYFYPNNIGFPDLPSSQFFPDIPPIFKLAMEFLSAVIAVRGLHGGSAFLSHARGDDEEERWLARCFTPLLRWLGIEVFLDLTDCGTGSDLNAYMDRIGTATRVIVIGSPLLYQKSLPDSTCTVPRELQRLADRMRDDRNRGTVLPLLLVGEEKTSLPAMLSGLIYTNLTVRERAWPALFDLFLQCYGLLNDATLQPCRWDLLDACIRPTPPRLATAA